MKKRGTKHGTGKGRWRTENRRYRSKKTGKWMYYWNKRERAVRKTKGGRRKIRYRRGGKGRHGSARRK